MRLLLDEMISPRIARELREAGRDVQAIKKDRPDLSGCADREIVQRMSDERRAIVTNDIDDFRAIHDRTLAAGEEHAGMVFTFDVTMPRRRDTVPLWVRTLADLLDKISGADALRNRIHYLP